MSEVAHDNGKRLRLFTGFINLYLIEEIAALNVLSEPLKTMGFGSRFQ
jgi:hypothetical protein